MTPNILIAWMENEEHPPITIDKVYSCAISEFFPKILHKKNSLHYRYKVFNPAKYKSLQVFLKNVMDIYYSVINCKF